MDTLLKPLTIERGQIKAALTRFKNFFETFANDVDIDSLEKRLKVNAELLDKFNRVQCQIEAVVEDSDQASTHEVERFNFEETYFDVMTRVEKHINRFRTPKASAASPAAATVEPQSAPRLPTIVLPNFNGDYNTWLRFRDTFESLVHNNESLSDIQRFHYLNSALKGQAARLIQSLGVSDANYRLAWSILKKRFEDSISLTYHHANSILEIPPIQKQSSFALREFVDTANNHLLALSALGEPTDKWDTIMILLLSKKLDSVTCKEWEKTYLDMSRKPNFQDLADFIEKQAKMLERATNRQSAINIPKYNHKQHEHKWSTNKNDAVASHIASTQIQCLLCKGHHPLQSCAKLKAMSFSERHETIKQLHCCFNCFQLGHSIKTCTRGKCRKCGRKHHTLLHREIAISSIEPESKEVTPTTSSIQSCVANSNSIPTDYSILSTALVYLEDREGKLHECRALLDVGSQANFITKSFVDKLGLSRSPMNTVVGGLGRATNPIHSKSQVSLKSRCNSFRTNLSCLIIKEITEDMPNVHLTRSMTPIPPGITLADPHFAVPGRIDLLIGAGQFWQLLCIGQHNAGGLTWQKTRLGWVLGGRIDFPNNKFTNVKTCHLVSNEMLHNTLTQFWEIENVDDSQLGGRAEIINEAEQIFRDTTTRTNEGRYMLTIPFNSKIDELGESRTQAERRLLAVERRLSRQPDLQTQYRQFMEEYEQLGHMTRIDGHTDTTDSAYYLPHHAVVKESSTTTKLRVVFDGSAKTSSGISLNETQFIGSVVQSDLFSIIVRFRRHALVLSADIEKMYRQILVRPEYRKYQRIVWRSSKDLPISTYQLNTVTYGTASAPFLATRVLRHIGEEHLTHYPLASKVIINDFYVDDLLTGCDTVSGLQQLKSELTEILHQAGFPLRKWKSNVPQLNDSHQDREIIAVDKQSKLLGLLWSPTSDNLHYRLKDTKINRITKRIILSEIAQIFDPLGLIGPIITQAKLMMQELWQLKVGWDETLPQNFHTQWSRFRVQLNAINSLSIPRCVMCNNFQRVELHGFSDASEKAYGACIYLRTLDDHGIWFTNLLCAKSRIAPLKTLSLPRLELCAALLLSKLTGIVKQSLQINIDREFYWSDSTITLAWIQGPPNRWKTFVANRTSKIRNLTIVDSWKHVASSDNPADIISRGATADSLISNSLWWSGPTWLSNDIEKWPIVRSVPQTIPEDRSTQIACTIVTEQHVEKGLDIFTRYSSYAKLRRVIGYCIKFKTILLNRIRKTNNLDPETNSHRLTTNELLDAELALIRLAQGEAFKSEADSLIRKKPLSRKSKLLPLNPFLDERGLIRVGGRLVNAQINYEHKHPAIVPTRHPLTTMLINHEHLRLLHAGCQQTLASLRRRVWPIAGKQIVKQTLHKCIRCFRTKPTSAFDIMGNLPASRVTPFRAFTTCGVDYAGPFLIKDRTRSRVIQKTYICLFVCFSTKAIHIELATDLSTDAFLNCLYRFIARRGKCKHIYSDNGTNFVGARNKFNELALLLSDKSHHDRVGLTLVEEQIEWHLIPPHAPHFGGLWESAVKSTKRHLKRVIGEQQLTFEELYTVLTQIEACLNSRPIHPLSSDLNDLDPLTPGHFLIGDALTALPQPELLDLNKGRLNRYQLLQQIVQHFWKRWQQEYLHELQQRHKWQAKSPGSLKINTLVIVREDNTPPLRWRLGRIMDIHSGADQVIRVVSVKTVDGIIKCPITKICILPLAEDDTSKDNQ